MRLKFLLFLAVLIFTCGQSFGQGFLYPEINNNGQIINDFIPENWILMDSTSGDFEFLLIEAVRLDANRLTGETEERNYNFLTKKVKILHGNYSNNKYKRKWRSFDIDTLKSFKTFVKPSTWEIETNYFI